MIRTILVLMISICMNFQVADARDLGDWIPNEDKTYKNMLAGEDISIGEIIFYSLEDRIPYEQLTDLDRFIIAGASKPGESVSMTPWLSRMMGLIDVYYAESGTLPGVMDNEAITSLEAFEDWENLADYYRNVYTDDWARLDASTPNPGDMYVKVLTKEEKIYLASRLPYFKRKFFLELPPGVTPDDHVVFYYRVYGSQGILKSSVYFTDPKSL